MLVRILCVQLFVGLCTCVYVCAHVFMYLSADMCLYVCVPVYVCAYICTKYSRSCPNGHLHLTATCLLGTQSVSDPLQHIPY
jgi:hypothetical protein